MEFQDDLLEARWLLIGQRKDFLRGCNIYALLWRMGGGGSREESTCTTFVRHPELVSGSQAGLNILGDPETSSG